MHRKRYEVDVENHMGTIFKQVQWAETFVEAIRIVTSGAYPFGIASIICSGGPPAPFSLLYGKAAERYLEEIG